MTDGANVDLRLGEPHGARIWNYWLGGKDNYEADRAVAEAVLAAYPSMRDYARTSRRFLVRAVRYLAGEAGVSQFLDIGTGLPTMQNTHEVAQALNPAVRVAYVDNDPLVLAHARALLTSSTGESMTAYIDADYNDPQLILDQARTVLDFQQPVAVLFMGVFGYLPDAEDARAVIRQIMDAVPAGSYMALWDGTDTSEAARLAEKAQTEAGSPYAIRSLPQMRRWFEGLELVEPGLVPIPAWRPDADEPNPDAAFDGYGAVGRKP